MTCSTSELAVCCSRASASSCVRFSSFFSRSRVCALSFFISDAWDSFDRATFPFVFVPVERSLRPRLGLFAPLRDKVTPQHVDRGFSCYRHLNHNTAVKGRCTALGPPIGVLNMIAVATLFGTIQVR